MAGIPLASNDHVVFRCAKKHGDYEYGHYEFTDFRLTCPNMYVKSSETDFRVDLS